MREFTNRRRLFGFDFNKVDVFTLVRRVPHLAHQVVDAAHALLVELHQRPLERRVKLLQIFAYGAVDLSFDEKKVEINKSERRMNGERRKPHSL